MHSLRRFALLLAFGAGCTSRQPEPTVPPPPPPPPPPTVAANEAATAAPDAAAPLATPDAAPPTPIAPPKSVVDPKTIEGAVMSKDASNAVAPAVAAQVTQFEIGQRKDWYVTWDLGFDAGQSHPTVKLYAPPALPAPLVVGDRVRVLLRPSGGGPNRRVAMVIEADDGSLLLAVNEAPKDWTVTQGKPGSVDRGPNYDTKSFGAHFQHSGKQADVPSGKWARLDVDGTSYYLWGSGASRKLHAGQRAMPDYVGGWLDFAIVRAR